MAKQFEEGTIPGSDVSMSPYQQYIPIQSDLDDAYLDPNPWLPKTDWSRDGIIANDDAE